MVVQFPREVVNTHAKVVTRNVYTAYNADITDSTIASYISVVAKMGLFLASQYLPTNFCTMTFELCQTQKVDQSEDEFHANSSKLDRYFTVMIKFVQQYLIVLIKYTGY